MLPKKHRLKKERNDITFQKIYSSKKFLQNDNFRLNFDFQSNEVSVCASVVSKKVSNSAVIRNRVRRQMYRVFENSPLYNLNTLRIIITAKPDAADMGFIELEKSLSGLLQKIRYTES